MGGAAGPGNRIDKVAGDWMLLTDDNFVVASTGPVNITGLQLNLLGNHLNVSTAGGVTMSGPLKVIGGIVADGVQSKAGVNDNFTLPSGRVVTVMGGLITSITPA